MASDADESGATAQASVTAAAGPRKRNQYNLEFKLEVASQYAPGVAGRGFEALAREYGLSKSNVMHWVAKKELIAERLAASGGGTAARNTFRLDGCGRKSAYSALEDQLEQWVAAQAAQGERVKDNDMKEQAMCIFRGMHADASAGGEQSFKASSGWLARFKQRKNLALRRASKSPGDDEPPFATVAGAVSASVGTVPERATDPDEADVQQRRVPPPPAAAASITVPVVSNPVEEAQVIAPAAASGRKAVVAPALATSVKRPAPPAAAPAPPPQALPPALLPVPPPPPLPVAPAQPPPPVDASMRLVSAEWMQSVDDKFSDLAQQIAHLVEGQNLLLGMLQRLQPPLAQPVRVASSVHGSSPMHNGFARHQQQAAAAHAPEYDAGEGEAAGSVVPAADATPPAKRRRLSILRSS